MKFFKKFDEIYGKVNENAPMAKKILADNGIAPNDPRYVELRDDLLKKSPGYLGQFTKFVFEQDITLDQVREVLRLIASNRTNITKLEKPIAEYSDFHNLLDDLSELERDRQARRILNNVPGDLRRELFELEADKLKPYIDLAVTISEYNEKEIKVFTDSISRAKDLEDLIIDMELFIKKMISDTSADKVKAKVESTEFSKVVYQDKNGILVARIGEFIDSFYLGSYNWCISKDGGSASWKQYVETEGNVQYFAWDFKRDKSDPMYMVGITVRQNGEIRDCQNSRNSSVNFNEFVEVYGLTGKKIFVGLTKKELAEKKKNESERLAKIAEFEAKQKEEKERRRKERQEERRNDATWEGDPMAHALREFLVDKGIMDETEDVYALEPVDYEHYGMKQYTYNDTEWAVSDEEEEADEAAKEWYKNILDEVGVGGNKWFIEDYIDGEAVARDYGYTFDTVYDSPDSYDVEKTLTDAAQKELEELESEKEQLEGEEGSDDRIYEIDERIEEINDTSNDEFWEYSEDNIQAKVTELNADFEKNPLDVLENQGVIRFIKNRNGDERPDEESGKRLLEYINKEDYIQACLDADGRGHALSGYDGEEHVLDFEGTTYYIYQVN